MHSPRKAAKAPCSKCPFRTDIKPFLRQSRAEQIRDATESGAPFWCHATVDYSNADDTPDGEGDDSKAAPCTGHLLVQLNENGHFNNMGRIQERLGLIGELDEDAPVFASFDEWIDEQEADA